VEKQAIIHESGLKDRFAASEHYPAAAPMMAFTVKLELVFPSRS
jgi:hypothetical protein